MKDPILVLYGSYRSDRKGIRLADFVVASLRARGESPELLDAKVIGLPMLDRMYKEYAKGEAPAGMEALATKIRTADAFIFVVGEYNWGMQPGLKNLTDHFLEEWRDCQLFRRTTIGCPIQFPLARDRLRDGYGCNLEHTHCRIHFSNPERDR
jgi:NAD(P)H-dependent FMN reductase